MGSAISLHLPAAVFVIVFSCLYVCMGWGLGFRTGGCLSVFCATGTCWGSLGSVCPGSWHWFGCQRQGLRWGGLHSAPDFCFEGGTEHLLLSGGPLWQNIKNFFLHLAIFWLAISLFGTYLKETHLKVMCAKKYASNCSLQCCLLAKNWNQSKCPSKGAS